MSKTNTQESSTSLHDIARRIGPPFLLFSSMLTAVLVFSQLVVLPALARVEAGGEKRSIAELKTYSDSLRAQIVSLEHERDGLILPIQDLSYRRLIQKKQEQLSIQDMYDAVQNIARLYADNGKDVVIIMGMNVSFDEHQLIIRGDVRNVGTRSMTILAQLTESFRSLDFAVNVQNPKYVRLQDEVIGMHSPFTIVIDLP